jgi:GxxExxY protein
MTEIRRAQVDRRDSQTYAIIGAAMEVHRTLGPGFLEKVYHSALRLELGSRNIPFACEVEVPVYYKGNSLGLRYRADLLCFGEVLVELKALKALTIVEEAQIINYLIATQIGRGILLNFGASALHYRRFVGPAYHLSRLGEPSVPSVVPTTPAK